MADNSVHTHHERETVREVPARSGGGGALAFIVGGLVAVVAIIAFVFWDDIDVDSGVTTGTGAGDVSVTIDNQPAAGDTATGDTSGGETAPVVGDTSGN